MATKEITLSFETTGGVLDPVSFDVSDGQSAYELWLSQGNTGTEQDFIDSLRVGATTLVSSVDNPVDVDKLDPGVYYLKERDNGYTLKNAPNFFPRTLTIEVTVGPGGTVMTAMADNEYLLRINRGFWSRIPSGDQTLLYNTSSVNGLYWSTGSGIYVKTNDTQVLGTATAASNTMMVKFKNPNSSTGNLPGVQHFINYQGDYKIFCGAESSNAATPSPTKLFRVPTISQASQDSLPISKVDPKNFTIQELADKYNRLVDLLLAAKLGKEGT